MLRVRFIKSVRLLRMGAERPFLDTDGICDGICYTAGANWRSVPCFGAIEMGWFVSGEIG